MHLGGTDGLELMCVEAMEVAGLDALILPFVR